MEIRRFRTRISRTAIEIGQRPEKYGRTVRIGHIHSFEEIHVAHVRRRRVGPEWAKEVTYTGRMAAPLYAQPMFMGLSGTVQTCIDKLHDL